MDKRNAMKWMLGSVAWILAFLIMNAESSTTHLCDRNRSLNQAIRSARDLTGLETIERLSVESSHEYDIRFAEGKRVTVTVDSQTCETLEVDTHTI
ncbi:MAG: hypothetical protein EOP09_06445 [Proteobacteria bacterium]|nr:MAG: hypothetical protein EOP09_06445 [Pseudomonadota bacterium]